MLSCFSRVQLFATLWTVARQAPLHGSLQVELPFPPPGDLPNPEMEPVSFASPALAGGFFTMSQIYVCLSNNPTWELWPE